MHKPQPSNDPGRPPKGPAGIGVPPSISDRQIEALGDIAKAIESCGRAYAEAVQEALRPFVEFANRGQEAQIAAPVPAERPDSGSGDSRTSEGVDGAPEGWQPVEGAPWMEWQQEGRAVRFRKAPSEGQNRG